MSVDLSQFHQVFIEESLEGLDAMESALMGLDLAHVDAELINTIFRAAHSIKGGSATFGFTVVAEFTHILETLLDQFRSGKRVIRAADVDLLLQSVDCMRDLVAQLKVGENRPTATAQQLKAQFESLLVSDVSATSVLDPVVDSRGAKSNADSASSIEITGSSDQLLSSSNIPNKKWRIEFVPGPDILKTGNDPLRIFAALEELGHIEVSAGTDAVPSFADLDAESIYVHWQIVLETTATEAVIREQFEWVIDDCKLTLVEITPPAPSTQPSATVAQAASSYSEKVEKKAVSAEASSIRVGIDKIDSLINMVGELVIIQSMLGEIGSDFNLSKLPKLVEGLAQLEQNTRELQESVMRIRMLPLSFAFSRFPRMVRDLAQQLNKKIHLEMQGEHTELDKTVMEKIGDPLVHLVRNAVDHGIESPEKRLQAGKTETGLVSLNAYHQGGNVVIEIKDDGAGLDRDKILRKAQQKGLVNDNDISLLADEQVYDLIFQPGFSTAESVSEVSGRGVGMDVVRRNIQALKGSVEINSRKGSGSTIRIRLPLTLAIMDGQLVRVGQYIYVFPLTSIVESLQIKRESVKNLAAGAEVFHLRNEYVPLVDLGAVFGLRTCGDASTYALTVVVESDYGKIGILVDELLAQQQVVIKSLEQNYKQVEGISGATILGDGTVALIVDIPGVAKLAERSRFSTPNERAVTASGTGYKLQALRRA